MNSPTGGRKNYTNKRKSERPPVGEISVEAERLAGVICTHICDDCRKEAQAALNESRNRVTDQA